MATEQEGDKRNVRGPRAVASLVPRLLRPAFRRRSPVGAQLLLDWTEIVGPALAAVTLPRRLSSTTLTIACAGAVATELQHMTTELLARINGHVGRPAVTRLRFVQDFSAAPTGPQKVERPNVPPPSVPGVPKGGLHDALSRLGQAIQRDEASRATKP